MLHQVVFPNQSAVFPAVMLHARLDDQDGLPSALWLDQSGGCGSQEGLRVGDAVCNVVVGG